MGETYDIRIVWR